jgi:hypothetical protein
MSRIIEGDLVNKLDDLDFDKDPFKVVGELIEAL